MPLLFLLVLLLSLPAQAFASDTPPWVAPLIDEVRALAAQGRPREALNLLEPACHREPEVGVLHLLRARALTALGRDHEARTLLGEVVLFRLDPAGPHAAEVALEVTLDRARRGEAWGRLTGPALRMLNSTPHGTARDPWLRLAVAGLSVRGGAVTGEFEARAVGHRELASSPVAWGLLAASLLGPWLLLAPLGWGWRRRFGTLPLIGEFLGALLLAWQAQVLAAVLGGILTAGTWSLALELGASAEGWRAVLVGYLVCGLGVIGWLGLIRRPAAYAALPGTADWRDGFRLGLALFAWVALLELGAAAAAAVGAGGITAIPDLFVANLRRPDLGSLLTGGDWLLLFTAMILIAPLVEELYFRGGLLSRWRSRIGFPGAALLTALVFAGAHLRHPLALFGAGIFLARAASDRGQVSSAVVAHAVWNLLALGLAAMAVR